MEEFATWAEFEYNVIVLLRFGKIDKSDNVGMIKLSHNLDFLQDIGSLQGTRSVFALKSCRCNE